MSKNFSVDKFLNDSLNKKEKENLLRNLRCENNLIDFCSNDYLGYARSDDLIKKFNEAKLFLNRIGSTGSRLISGNYKFTEELEKYIAEFHGAEAGLIFNSGFDANLGLLSSIPQRGDTVIYDELSHASVREGVRLSFANSYSFKHNDICDLQSKLEIAKGNIFVIVESVYSMNGDFALLEETSVACNAYNANLIVDEAHATGVVGNKGEGLVKLLNLQGKTFARMHTFGKAIGSHGAIILGSSLLRKYLLNFSHSFFYTTALPLHSLVSVKLAYEKLSEDVENINKLKELINLFKSSAKEINSLELIKSESAIQSVIIPGNDNVKKIAQHLQENGLDVRPILSPTIPKGKERLRIILHSFNKEEEVKKLIDVLKQKI
ncbi:MAG: pyridoxal phosphate-dependent aminotransferase family protein [Bacteroidales bacterium]|jgi:8-amino-7-oxononanoate synthase